jgi:hypothetical protein
MTRYITIRLARLAFVVLSLFTIYACERTPKSIEDLSYTIRTVTYSEEKETTIARIELDGVFGSDEANFFFKASQEMFKILKKMTAYFPEDQQQVNFVLKVNLQNAYGKFGDRAVIEVPFSMSEVKKITFFTSSSGDILNMSNQVRYAHPVGRNIVRSFCDNGKYQKRAARFCLLAKN